MSCTHLFVYIALGERQKTACCDDFVSSDNNRSVVKRGFCVENTFKKRRAEGCVEPCTRVKNVVVNIACAVDDYDCAHVLFCHILTCRKNFSRCVAELVVAVVRFKTFCRRNLLEEVFEVVLIHHARRHYVKDHNKMHNIFRYSQNRTSQQFGKHVDKHVQHRAEQQQEKHLHVALVNEKAQHDCENGHQNHHIDDEIKVDAVCVLSKVVCHKTLSNRCFAEFLSNFLSIKYRIRQTRFRRPTCDRRRNRLFCVRVFFQTRQTCRPRRPCARSRIRRGVFRNTRPSYPRF